VLYPWHMALSPRTLRLLAYAAIYVFWGGSFLAIRDVVAVTPPFFVAAIRFFLAGAALYAYTHMRGVPPPRGRPLYHSLLMGVVLFTVSYGCLFWSETRIASGTAAVIAAMIPVWILLGEVLVLRTQRLTLAVSAAAALGIAGVFLVTRSAGMHHSMLRGVLIQLFGTLVFAFGTLLSRSLTLPVNQAQRSALQMALGSLGLFVLSAVTGELSRVPAAVAAWHWHSAVSFLYLVFCASLLGFTSYTWLIHHEPPSRVSSYAYVNPLIALVLGVTLGGEHILPLQLAGAAMIILGVAGTLLSRGHLRAQPAPRSGR